MDLFRNTILRNFLVLIIFHLTCTANCNHGPQGATSQSSSGRYFTGLDTPPSEREYFSQAIAKMASGFRVHDLKRSKILDFLESAGELPIFPKYTAISYSRTVVLLDEVGVRHECSASIGRVTSYPEGMRTILVICDQIGVNFFAYVFPDGSVLNARDPQVDRALMK